jgi:Ser/Thr protein kinase RdoA (MazF antagonist)
LDDDKYSFDEKINLLRKYISKIYEKYLLLCDNGIIWNDLYCRNILVDDNDNEKIYFIDFDFEFSEKTITQFLKIIFTQKTNCMIIY